MKPKRLDLPRAEPWPGIPSRGVLGLPLRVMAADPPTASAAGEATRVWGAPAVSGASALELRIACDAALSGTEEVSIEVTGSRLALGGPGARGHADAAARIAGCTVSQDFLRSPERLREQVLEPLVLFMATRNGRTPIHASSFVLEDLAVLLAGPSGAGKSCLALAADRAGYAVLSDDTVYVEHGPPPRVWGMPDAAHLLPADSSGVPAGRQRLRARRLKQIVPLRSAAHGGPIACRRATLCLLARGAEPALRRIDRQEALSRLERLDSGFDLIRERVLRAHALLAANGAWELTLSRDPAAAIGMLARHFALLRTTSVP